MTDQNQVPFCPGCHFGCALDDYQCHRGARFYEKWQAGEEIPARRGPGRPGGGAQGGHGAQGKGSPGANRPAHVAKMPPSARLRMLLNIYGNINRDHELAYADRRVAECILRQDGCAALPIIVERTRFSPDVIEDALNDLLEQGIVGVSYNHQNRSFYELTEEGRPQVEDWIAEHQAGDEAFFSELSANEQNQLESLLAKLLQPHMHRGR